MGCARIVDHDRIHGVESGYHLGLIIDSGRLVADDYRPNNTGDMPRTIAIF
jgi:hypothetical protein